MKVMVYIRTWLKSHLTRWIYCSLESYTRKVEEQHKEQLKIQLKHCGQSLVINGQIVIMGAASVTIGDNVHIGDNAFIQGLGGLEIGDNTHISRNLVLYTVNHDYESTRLPYDETRIHKAVKIGKNVWIGTNVCIVPGTTIGDGAIVGMGTVVSGNVPPLAIIGSTAWRKIGERSQKHYSRLEQIQAYGGIDGRPIDQSRET